MSSHDQPDALKEHILKFKDYETDLLAMLEEIEAKHGFIPKNVADEVQRLLQVKRERLDKILTKVKNEARVAVESHVANWKDEEGNLIMILHSIQNQHGYIPRDIAMELAQALGIKLARIYEVITFYHYFRLQPPGKHNVALCNGTACYLKGAQSLRNEIEKHLGIQDGETTKDRMFHFESVRCIGCCGMAPAITVDGKVYGKVTPAEVEGILDAVRRKEKQHEAV